MTNAEKLSIVHRKKTKKVRKKRSTLKDPVRENRPLAGRRFQEEEAEGSFGTGAVKGSVAVFVWSALKDREMCGASRIKKEVPRSSSPFA